jgi:hypothetical protein
VGQEWLMVRKIRTSIALDKEQLEWIQQMVKRKRFASISHGVEFAVERLREEDKSGDVHFHFAYDQEECGTIKKKTNP